MIAKCTVIWIVLLIVGGLALVIGANVWYTRTTVEHECTALNLILKRPVVKPSNPKVTPVKASQYEFYLAIQQWARQDGCT